MQHGVSTMSALDLGNPDQASVFQGGNYLDLHQMLGVRSGTEVLYVGDHIYGDILRSKKVPHTLQISTAAFN